MKKIRLFLICCLMLIIPVFASNEAQKQEYKNDYLYSQEYFDYLIECASEEKQEQEVELEEEKFEQEALLEPEYILVDDVIDKSYEPFKLHIETYTSSGRYRETYKQENSKVLIPVSDSFSYMTNMTKTKNKYNSQDYKILVGAEYSPFDFLSFGAGLETNYRGLDQNPNSRKLFFTPKIMITDKVSIIFPNKINIHSSSIDHDIGLNVSPFKSKFMDFGVYGGVTRTSEGKTTQSINFSTNWYLF